MQTQNNTPDTLVGLLKGEMSAMETYQKALEKVDGYPEGAQLRQIYMDHSHAVQVLRNLLMRYQVELPNTSGAWGTFASAVQSVANLFGDATALRALKLGEENGIKDYQKALDDPSVSTDVKAVIRSDLLRKSETHVPVLDSLMEH